MGDGFGADVIKMNGRGVCTTASAGVLHAESKNARSAMVKKVELDFSEVALYESARKDHP